ncbi:Synembryn-A [Amphibalanus amphitrite]|uniref:Synembryn-A n=1 Tax=Amphibalanus amphitrite TaxID=1232801 RepID=A0A6A4X3A4_AMPAM|nr:Synembryn-A [Amphibalanus amphitrite]KAF0313747.1 Synembryn-A [Amphibalanus amphitrite]
MDTDQINSLENAGQEEIEKLLQSLATQLGTCMTFPELSAAGRRERVWRALFRWLESEETASSVQTAALALLRILTRDEDGLDRVVTSERVDRLIALAGLQTQECMEQKPDNNPDYKVIEEAAKCMCNLCRQSGAARRLAAGSAACLQGLTLRLRAFREPELTHDVKLYSLKLLFLLSTLCPEIRLPLVHDHHGLTYMTEVLDMLLSTSLASAAPDDERARGVELASEILKVVYSVTHSLASPDEEDEGHLMRLTEVLREYLVLSNTTEDLTNFVVQVLTTVPSNCYPALLVPEAPGARPDSGDDTAALDTVLHLLGVKLQQTQSLPASCQREQLTPILAMMSYSSKACRAIRRYFRAQILPPRRDVLTRPEEGSSLRSQLIRLMTSPVSEVKVLAAHLLFVLCKEDVGRFVKYTGYGNAAGLLAARGLMLGGPRPAGYSSDSDSDTEEYVRYQDSMDPVTGRVEPPRPDPMAGYSEERKIHEAEKLVTLINQSIDNGLIQPCRVGADGKPHPISHVLELQEGAAAAATGSSAGAARPQTDSDSE